MHSYLLSDLHLKPEQPNVIAAFLGFLQQQAASADKVYILGDLFEFWIGDDAAALVGAEPILAAMKAVSAHTDCYFMAGNRDFLVTEQFTELTGFKLLEDETVIDLHGTPTLLLHGDSMCTDDLPHMQFREQMVTNKAWQQQFLSLPIEQRIEQAKLARMESNKYKTTVSDEIMDVTESAVIATFEKHDVQQMIHGHTHRQNVHQYQFSSQTHTRYVLGDWHDTSSVMTASVEGLKIDNLPI